MRRFSVAVVVLAILAAACSEAKLVETRHVGTVLSAVCAPGGISADRTTVVTTKMSVSLVRCHSVAIGEDAWISRYDDGWPMGKQCWFYTSKVSYPCT